jgi:hypothetical protein
MVHAFHLQQARGRIGFCQQRGLQGIDLDIRGALRHQQRHLQPGKLLCRHILEPGRHVGLHAGAIDGLQLGRQLAGPLPAFERREYLVVGPGQVGRQFGAELAAQQGGCALGRAGQGDKAVSARLARSQHADQRAFAVAYHRNGCIAPILP